LICRPQLTKVGIPRTANAAPPLALVRPESVKDHTAPRRLTRRDCAAFRAQRKRQCGQRPRRTAAPHPPVPRDQSCLRMDSGHSRSQSPHAPDAKGAWDHSARSGLLCDVQRCYLGRRNQSGVASFTAFWVKSAQNKQNLKSLSER
jgi:hypothetical protein